MRFSLIVSTFTILLVASSNADVSPEEQQQAVVSSSSSSVAIEQAEVEKRRLRSSRSSDS